MILDTSTNTSYVQLVSYFPALNLTRYAPTLAVDSISGPYAVQCLKDKTTGAFCEDIIMGFNATNGISSLPQSELCSYCVLATMNATLLNSVLFTPAMEAFYDSLSTTCGIPEFNPSLVTSPVVSPGTPAGVNSTSPVSALCAQLGQNVTVSAESTCAAIAAQFSVSFYDVYSSNSLPQAGCNVAAGSKLCLPQACTTYTVVTNDTCLSIATAANITTVQLQIYNPNLGSTCQFLSTQAGNLICVGPHGGFPDVSATTAPIGPSGTATTLAPLPSPTAVGSTAACGEWASQFGITLDDILAWNPWLSSSCALQIGQNVCVNGTAVTSTGPPANIAAGTLTNCTTYYTIASGDTCTAIDEKYDISLSDLLRWNTALTSACTTIQLNEAYCVAGGGNVCTKIYTVVSNDTCGGLETKFGVTLNQILAWNPWLTSSC
ncbi:hypothetical protein C8R45DRAFT_1185524, partial [Mycena sanguinolenta]